MLMTRSRESFVCSQDESCSSGPAETAETAETVETAEIAETRTLE
jgi:hypothetical protein